MEDRKIIELYVHRDEKAIKETSHKYGPYCFSIANRILNNKEDSDECVNDTWLKAWNLIPPTIPKYLHLFLAKLTRNLSFDKYRMEHAKKRGGGEIVLALEELENCVDVSNTENTYEQKELTWVLNQFLSSLSETERNVFLCRYWYMDSIKAISEYSGFTQSKITSMLHRTREKLRKRLIEEGYL